MLRGVIIDNSETCRTEAEIQDESGARLAVIYEEASGWHTDLSDQKSEQESPEFKTLVEGLKKQLSRFVNRKGQHPPPNLTAGTLSLWLMKKKESFWQ